MAPVRTMIRTSPTSWACGSSSSRRLALVGPFDAGYVTWHSDGTEQMNWVALRLLALSVWACGSRSVAPRTSSIILPWLGHSTPTNPPLGQVQAALFCRARKHPPTGHVDRSGNNYKGPLPWFNMTQTEIRLWRPSPAP